MISSHDYMCTCSVDIEQQKHEVFLFMAKNSMTLEITWEKIADTLEHFMSMGNLAHNIRTKLNLQPSLAEGIDILMSEYIIPQFSYYVMCR